MKNKSMALAIAAMLSACGGGGDSDGGRGPDSVADQYVLKARVAGLTGSVAVADGRGGEVAIGNDGEHTVATLPGGTPYTAMVTRQPDSQVCLIDEPSGVIGGDVGIRVDCADGIGLSLGMSTYAVAQLVLVDVPGDPPAVTASIGGAPIALVPHAGAFSFLMPDLAPGTHALEVQAHGRVFRKDLGVTANPLVEPAPDYLARRATAAIAAMDALVAGGNLSQEERSLALELKAQLEAALPGIGGLPPEEALQLARMLAANENLAAEGWPALLQTKAPGCLTHARVFATGVMLVAGSVGLANASVTSGPGVALFASAALAGAVTGAITLRDGLRGIVNVCFDAKKLRTDADGSDLVGSSGLTRGFAGVRAADAARATKQAKSVDGSPGELFDHGVSRRVTPAVVMRLSDEVGSGTLAQARALARKYEGLREWASGTVSLPRIPLLEEASALQRESLRRADPAELRLQTSTSMIGASGVPEGNQLSMTFRLADEPMPVEPTPFAFRLRHDRLGIVSDAVWARLRPPSERALPDVRFIVYKDGPYRGVLAGGDRHSHALAEAPANGTVTLEDPSSGRFVYSPPPRLVGADRFTYVAHDADGTPAPGTVHVEVSENCLPTRGNDYHLLECRYSVLDATSFYPWTYSSLITPTLLHGPLVFNERPDYIGYYEYSSEAADKASVAPSGTAVHVQVYRVQRDPEADRFSVSGSGGYYDAASGARVGRSQFNWERGRIVRHRNGVDYMFDSATTAWLFNDLIEGQVVRSGVAWRSVTLSGYRADGSPTYAGQDIGCSTGFLVDDGVLAGRTWVTVSNIRDDAEPVVVNHYEGVCPITEETLSHIATESRPADLRLDWRTGAPR